MNHWCDVTTENTKAILGCINKTTVPRKIEKIVSIYSNRYSDWRFSREKTKYTIEGLDVMWFEKQVNKKGDER